MNHPAQVRSLLKRHHAELRFEDSVAELAINIRIRNRWLYFIGNVD
jgi:hypothetical protein